MKRITLLLAAAVVLGLSTQAFAGSTQVTIAYGVGATPVTAVHHVYRPRWHPGAVVVPPPMWPHPPMVVPVPGYPPVFYPPVPHVPRYYYYGPRSGFHYSGPGVHFGIDF